MTDVDGDGSSDLVWSYNEHEGGASSISSTLAIYAHGKPTPIGRVANLDDLHLVARQLVVSGRPQANQRPIYACVRRDLQLARCAAVTALQRASDKLDAANQLAKLTELPDPISAHRGSPCSAWKLPASSQRCRRRRR